MQKLYFSSIVPARGKSFILRGANEQSWKGGQWSICSGSYFLLSCAVLGRPSDCLVFGNSLVHGQCSPGARTLETPSSAAFPARLNLS
jgi:hypothetical protein